MHATIQFRNFTSPIPKKKKTILNEKRGRGREIGKHNRELHNLHSSPNIIEIIIASRMK
jgi:hypothetical protein